MQRTQLLSLVDETLRWSEIVLRFEKRAVSRSLGDLMHRTKHTVARAETNNTTCRIFHAM